ncbi:MAG: pyridoxamine 5'-phosphate oxidase family protein [Acidimicrobiia bacterium]
MPMTGPPLTELDAPYSGDGASAMPWADAAAAGEAAEIYWLSTVRPDGRPHVTPLLCVWLDDALHFCTGAEERKAKNLASNANCVLTTGNNTFQSGLDLVVEGSATRITDEPTLLRLAARWAEKYGTDWAFEVKDAAFEAEGHRADVFQVRPVKAYAYGRDDNPSATRYRWTS